MSETANPILDGFLIFVDLSFGKTMRMLIIVNSTLSIVNNMKIYFHFFE